MTGVCTLLRMTSRRPRHRGAMHAIEDALSQPLPEIESAQTRAAIGDYLDDLRELADRVVPGRLRIALRRHIITIQRRLDEYDAAQGDK